MLMFRNSFALITLSIKTVNRRLSTHTTSNCESKGLLFTTVK